MWNIENKKVRVCFGKSQTIHVLFTELLKYQLQNNPYIQ